MGGWEEGHPLPEEERLPLGGERSSCLMASIFPKEAETRSSDEGEASGREHSSVDARGEGVVIICRVCTGPVGGTQEDE